MPPSRAGVNRLGRGIEPLTTSSPMERSGRVSDEDGGGVRDDGHVIRRLVPVLVTFALAGCGHASPSAAAAHVVRFGGSGSGSVLHVDVAGTQQEREQGLMNVTDLSSDAGMAFVWSEPTTGLFWMKDTLIPLSIAFVGQDGRVVSIDEMTPCTADPCPTYGAGGAYVLAIEANAGWFTDHGVKAGDRAQLQQVELAS